MSQTISSQDYDLEIQALKEQIQVLRQHLPFYQLERDARLAPPAHSFDRHNAHSQQIFVPQICLRQIKSASQLTKALDLCANYPTLIIDLGTASGNHLTQAYQDLKTIRKTLPEHFLIIRDQIVDEYQILTARHLGADGIILSLSDLEPNRSKIYCNKVHLWGMEPMMQVKQLAELEALVGLPTRCVWLDPENESERSPLLQSQLLKSFYWSSLSVSNMPPSQRPPTQQLIASCALWQESEPEQHLQYLQSFYQKN